MVTRTPPHNEISRQILGSSCSLAKINTCLTGIYFGGFPHKSAHIFLCNCVKQTQVRGDCRKNLLLSHMRSERVNYAYLLRAVDEKFTARKVPRKVPP